MLNYCIYLVSYTKEVKTSIISTSVCYPIVNARGHVIVRFSRENKCAVWNETIHTWDGYRLLGTTWSRLRTFLLERTFRPMSTRAWYQWYTNNITNQKHLTTPTWKYTPARNTPSIVHHPSDQHAPHQSTKTVFIKANNYSSTSPIAFSDIYWAKKKS